MAFGQAVSNSLFEELIRNSEAQAASSSSETSSIVNPFLNLPASTPCGAAVQSTHPGWPISSSTCVDAEAPTLESLAKPSPVRQPLLTPSAVRVAAARHSAEVEVGPAALGGSETEDSVQVIRRAGHDDDLTLRIQRSYAYDPDSHHAPAPNLGLFFEMVVEQHQRAYGDITTRRRIYRQIYEKIATVTHPSELGFTENRKSNISLITRLMDTPFYPLILKRITALMHHKAIPVKDHLALMEDNWIVSLYAEEPIEEEYHYMAVLLKTPAKELRKQTEKWLDDHPDRPNLLRFDC